MGCDAHFFLEKRVNKGSWEIDSGHKYCNLNNCHTESHPIEIPSLSGRSYYFFGLIAGIRSNEAEPLIEPRGLPPDLSTVLLNYFNSGGFHTPTYLTPKEMERVFKKYLKYLNKESMKESAISDQDYYLQAEDAFCYDESKPYFRINASIVKYIRSNLDWEKIENKLLGLKNKTEYRIVVWFDS